MAYSVHGLNNFATGAFLVLTGVTVQEILFARPLAHLTWLIGQVGLVILLAPVLFGKGIPLARRREAQV